MLARHRNLLLAAAENVARNSAGYAVAAAALVLALTLLLSGVAISEGLKVEALGAVDAGASVYCTWDHFGREGPVPRDRIEMLRDLEGVTRVVPRIIGRLVVNDRVALVIGVPFDELRSHPVSVEGELPNSPEEILVGHELGRAAGLEPGSTVALEAYSIRLFKVAGVVSTTSALVSAKAIVCELDEAAELFGDKQHVTDICLYTRPGYEKLVAEAVSRVDRRFRIQTRTIAAAYVQRGMSIREGVFTILFALALVLAIPAFAITTYLGHSPRRREIGLLKADGWSTADVLEMVAFENLIVSLLSASLSLCLAVVWVNGLRAPLIASFFMPGLPLFPEMAIPSQFLPLPALLAFVFSVVVTMSGSIVTTWRTAATRPVEVLR